MTDIKKYYETLGVACDAQADEIKAAYRRLARELHPDANPDPEAQEIFKKVTNAYATLGDPEKRQRYDAILHLLVDGGPEAETIFAPVTPNTPARRPLPPHLSRSEVDFELVEQDDSSMPQIRVRITNPNADPTLRPVLRPTEGRHWWARLHVDDKKSYFTISPKLSMAAAGVYGDSLDVYWEGMPDLVATLDISLRVIPKPFNPLRSDFEFPTVAPVQQAARQEVSLADYEPSRGSYLAGAALLMLLGLACLVGPPLLSQLPYFQRADPNPNIGRDIVAILLFIVWLGGSGGCFYGMYHFLDEWGASRAKKPPEPSIGARKATRRRAVGLLILGSACFAVPPTASLLLYLSQSSAALSFNDIVIFVMLGLICIVGTPTSLYYSYKNRRG